MRSWLVAAVLVSLAVGAVVLVVTHRSGSARGLHWSVASRPFGLTFRVSGRQVTSEARSGDAVGRRIGYVLEDGSAHVLGDLLSKSGIVGGTRYVIGTDEAGRHAVVTVTRRARGLRVDYRLEPSSRVGAVIESLTGTSAEHFLGGGEDGTVVDLRGHVASERVSYSCGSEFPMPFYVSTAGYGLFAPTLHVGRMAFPGTEQPQGCAGVTPPCPLTPDVDRVELCFKGASLTYDVYEGSPADVLRAFTADAGRAPVPPVSEFGAQKWRGAWPDNTAATLRADAITYRRLGIPLTWMHVNDPWEVRGCWGTQTFDPRRFPDPAGLVRWLRSQGLETMIWVSPLVLRARTCPRLPYTRLVGSGPSPMIDLSDPAMRNLFERRLERVFAIGIRGVKGDRGDEFDLERSSVARHADLQNLYPVLFARAVTTALRKTTKQGFATIFRAGALGSQAVLPGIWVGDEPGTFGGMQTALRAGLTASMSGAPVWGSDIGGYANATPELTAELFTRWAQLGAVTPIFEVGGQGTSSHFWDFGAATAAAFRDASILHYELVPYFADLARAANASGQLITRPLGYSYPDDPGSWSAEFEFTVGGALLAAPVVGGGTTPSVYLPPGDWLDLFDGSVHTGPTTFTRQTPDDQFPLYLRAGAVIPFNLREPELWAQPWGLADLVRPDRAGWLVAPGGSGSFSSFSAGRATVTSHGTQLAVRIDGAPRQTEVLVLTPTLPVSVEVGGRVVPEAPAPALRRLSTGWTFRPGPLAGALVKLGSSAEIELHLR